MPSKPFLADPLAHPARKSGAAKCPLCTCPMQSNEKEQAAFDGARRTLLLVIAACWLVGLVLVFVSNATTVYGLSFITLGLILGFIAFLRGPRPSGILTCINCQHVLRRNA